jgi:hypothetical protein
MKVAIRRLADLSSGSIDGLNSILLEHEHAINSNQFGTFVACAGASGIATGYISIKDAAGTVRFIPVW